MKETRKIRQLQRHRDKPGQELGRFQQHLLDSYTNRKNRLVCVILGFYLLVFVYEMEMYFSCCAFDCSEV